MGRFLNLPLLAIVLVIGGGYLFQGEENKLASEELYCSETTETSKIRVGYSCFRGKPYLIVTNKSTEGAKVIYSSNEIGNSTIVIPAKTKIQHQLGDGVWKKTIKVEFER